MYETMAVWGNADFVDGQPPLIHDYARIWRTADKVVYGVVHLRYRPI